VQFWANFAQDSSLSPSHSRVPLAALWLPVELGQLAGLIRGKDLAEEEGSRRSKLLRRRSGQFLLENLSLTNTAHHHHHQTHINAQRKHTSTIERRRRARSPLLVSKSKPNQTEKTEKN